MQVVIPRWRNSFIFKSSIVSSSSANLGLFHSTPVYSEKWKNKWTSAFGQPQHPSKNYIRYTTRQKRADAKRALKDILFKGGSSKITIQNYFPEIFGKYHQNVKQEDHANCSDWKSSSMSSADRASRSRRRRMKRKIRQEGYEDDFYAHFETVYETAFGNRWYNWSFRNWKDSKFQYSNNEFEWRNHSNWTKNESRDWRNASDVDSDEETCGIGSSSEREILGLPLKGPLKRDDVKKAFRLSALKWHPDKHQSSSQVSLLYTIAG